MPFELRMHSRYDTFEFFSIFTYLYPFVPTPTLRCGPLPTYIFDPFLTHFWSQKQPNLKAFCDFAVAKMACNGLKRGSFHLFVHPKWSRIIFGKTHF